MDRIGFENELRSAGFEVSENSVAAREQRHPHAHDFDVEALVIEGEITLACNGESKTYRAGDRFSMAAGIPHKEVIGPEGVRYVVGRRRRST